MYVSMLKNPIGIWPWLLEGNEMGIVGDLGPRFNDSRPRDIVTDYSIFSKWRIILLSQVCANLRSVGDIKDLQTSQKIVRSITYHRLAYFV